jgi:hypothetical protein
MSPKPCHLLIKVHILQFFQFFKTTVLIRRVFNALKHKIESHNIENFSCLTENTLPVHYKDQLLKYV